MLPAQQPALPEHCRSLFLGDLSCFCQDKDIYDAFSVYGEIESIRLMRGKDNKCLGYGFITFFDIKATIAAHDMDGKVVLGRPLKVGWAHMKSKIPKPHVKKAKDPHDPSFHSAQVHFSFIAKQASIVVTEATIRSVFEQFGPIEDVCIKKSVFDEAQGEQNGYGFIHYAITNDGIKSAIRATSVLRQVVIDNVLYDSCLTHSLEHMLVPSSPDAQSPKEMPVNQYSTPGSIGGDQWSSSSMGIPAKNSTYPSSQMSFHGQDFNPRNHFKSHPTQHHNASFHARNSGSTYSNYKVPASNYDPNPMAMPNFPTSSMSSYSSRYSQMPATNSTYSNGSMSMPRMDNFTLNSTYNTRDNSSYYQQQQFQSIPTSHGASSSEYYQVHAPASVQFSGKSTDSDLTSEIW